MYYVANRCFFWISDSRHNYHIFSFACLPSLLTASKSLWRKACLLTQSCACIQNSSTYRFVGAIERIKKRLYALILLFLQCVLHLTIPLYAEHICNSCLCNRWMYCKQTERKQLLKLAWITFLACWKAPFQIWTATTSISKYHPFLN